LDGWTDVVTLSARGDSAYELVVPTLADSTASGIHPTVLMVRAMTATPTAFYDSPADSGYSVDNLPPAPPAPFVAAYAGGVTHLHWGASTEPDLWYYRLYRGSSAGFAPGPANLIAAVSDTGYADTGPVGSCYKLSAVDMNGNESGYALVTPGGTTAVPDGGTPGALTLTGVRPNPAAGGRLAVSFSLPTAEPARLELWDVTGRRVAAREVGSLGAGAHEVDLAFGAHVPAGLYLVRLTQGEAVRATRVAVIE
ncbi:MAG TPA: T9SS type A sorting domain-containing protein, partial [Dongiaceae bacterium]|nr:T9SS type A sorting domain-containing protein [Dongiaceae bacterium]